MKKQLLLLSLAALSLNAVTPEQPNLKVTNNTNSDLNVRVKVQFIVEGVKAKAYAGSAHISVPANSCGSLDLGTISKKRTPLNAKALNASEIRIIKVRARNEGRSFTGGVKSQSKKVSASTPTKAELASANELEMFEADSKVRFNIK